MVKILCFTRYDWSGPSSRYRFYQFFPFFEKENIEITVCPLFNNKYVENLFSEERRWKLFNPIVAHFKRTEKLIFHQNCDLVWMEKEALPWIPAFFETALYKKSLPYVIDYDDAVFHRYDQHSNPLIRGSLSKKIDKIMARSKVVVAGNQYIADYAQKAVAPRVEVLPTVVDLSNYKVKETFNSLPFTIGWIGSPITSRYISIAGEALNNFCQQEDVEFRAMGALWRDLDEIPGKLISWNAETETEELTRFDVGIMPLPDTPWERGKCGFKLIQYMASGIPVIASPVGINSEIVDHGLNGYLAASTEEWIEYLKMLKENPDLCRKMGAAGRQKVERDYSLQETAPRLVELLKEAAEV